MCTLLFFHFVAKGTSMTTNAPPYCAASSQAFDGHDTPPCTAAGLAVIDAVDLGGNTLARIVEDHCPDMLVAAGVVIEHLDAQAGAWEFSLDQGRSWRGVRTDLINRAGNMGLALDRDARLRVLPVGGHRVNGARVAFHTVQRSHAQGNGSYRAYACEERDGGSHTVTLVLSLAAINGVPPAVHVPRPRNKRAAAQRAASTAESTPNRTMLLV